MINIWALNIHLRFNRKLNGLLFWFYCLQLASLLSTLVRPAEACCLCYNQRNVYPLQRINSCTEGQRGRAKFSAVSSENPKALQLSHKQHHSISKWPFSHDLTARFCKILNTLKIPFWKKTNINETLFPPFKLLDVLLLKQCLLSCEKEGY